MKKNLLAIFLAVVMIAAVVFIAAPNAKAADANVITANDNGETISVAAGDIVNLAGKTNVKINVTGSKDEENPVEVAIIDTSVVSATKGDGSPDLSGENPGTAIISGTGYYKVKDWEQYDGYKYLKVANRDGTYSFHPFNITIDKYGVNNHYSAVSIRVTVIANDVVAKLIDAGEFGLHNYNLAGKDEEYSPYWKTFAGEETNGIRAYYYLDGSFASGVLTDNRYCTVSAYIKLNDTKVGGELIIESNTKLDIYPKSILIALNNDAAKYDAQKHKVVKMLNKEGNDYLKTYLGSFLESKPTIPENPKTYTFADYTAGTQYADNEVHKLDDYITVTTTDAHFTSELRLYSSSTYNGYAIITSTHAISKITFNAGYKVDTLNVYVSNDDGATWELASGISVTSTSYKDYSISLDGATCIKLDVANTNQIRIKYMTVTFAQDSGSTEPDPSEPTDPSEPEECTHADNNKDYKCDSCSEVMLPEDGATLTIPQALAVAKVAGTSYTTQKYYITGIVTGLYNTTYGNFYIKDDAGNEICIYGLYSADGSTRYDALSYKPVNGDKVTVYTILGMYDTTAQGKSAWLDEVVAHEHDYESVVTDPGCLTTGYTTHTCSICGNSYTDSETKALGHTTDNGLCTRCNTEIGGNTPVVETLATFDFGTNGSASHVDGNSLGTSKSYTVGSYTLTLNSMSSVYGPAYDLKGNSCIKLGTSSKTGSFSFNVPDNVTEVVIYIAKYKANTTKITVNSTAYTLTKNSNDGAYDEIVIDTTTNKTVTLTTVSGGVRAMVNTIVFNGVAK